MTGAPYRSAPASERRPLSDAEAALLAKLMRLGRDYYPAGDEERRAAYYLRGAKLAEGAGEGAMVTITAAGRDLAMSLARSQSVGVGRSGVPST